MKKIKIEQLLFLVILFLSWGQFVDLKTMPADASAPAEDVGMEMSDEMGGDPEMGVPTEALPTQGTEPIAPEAVPPASPDQGPASFAFVPETKTPPTGEIPITPSSAVSAPPAPFKQEWEQIKNDVEVIDQLETKILEQLRQLDDSLDAAMDESVNAKKVSIEMLNITDESAAQANLNKLKEHLNKVKQIQRQVQQEFAKNFDVTLTEIQSKMQAVQDRVKILEKQGLIAEAELEKQVEVEVPPVEEIIEKEEESYWFKKGVSVVAGTIRLIKKTIDLTTSFVSNVVKWTRDVIEKGVAKSKKGEEAEPSKAPTPQQPGPGMAPPQELSSPVAQAQPAALQQVGPEMQELEQSMAEMQQEKTQISQTREKLEKMKSERSDQLQKKLAMIEEKLGTKLSDEKKEELKEILIKKSSGWRGEIEYLFGKVLDLLTFIGKKIRSALSLFYEDFLKKKFRRFLSAVEKRVSQIEQEGKGDKKAVLTESIATEPAAPPPSVESVQSLVPEQVPEEMAPSPTAPAELPAEGPVPQTGVSEEEMAGAPEEMSPSESELMGAGGGGMGGPEETGPPPAMGM